MCLWGGHSPAFRPIHERGRAEGRQLGGHARGIEVGQVENLSMDQKNQRAVVEMRIRKV